MEGGEGGQGDDEESIGRCSSIPYSIRIGHPSPGNSHHGAFLVQAETSAINRLALNTEPITLTSIPECDAYGSPSRNCNDLRPAPSLPTNVTEGGNSHHGAFVVRAETSAINSSALNTEPITLTSIPEWDACGAPSRNYNDLHPAPSLPTNVTEGEILEATDYYGSKYVLTGTVKYKIYANYQHRLASFPKSFPSVKTAEELADAGFLYHSAPDSVVCFCCGVGFKEWKPEDEPLNEHAVRFPSCLYMQVKGLQIVPQQMRINASATALRTNSSSRFCQEERHLTAADSSSAVLERKIIQALADMGYSSETIQVAIRCVQRKGAEIDLEVVANTILDMDQKKTNRARSVCYLCQRDFINGFTLRPCGHLAVCMKCKVDKVAKCPVCGEIVESYVRTYPECQTLKP